MKQRLLSAAIAGLLASNGAFASEQDREIEALKHHLQQLEKRIEKQQPQPSSTNWADRFTFPD